MSALPPLWHWAFFTPTTPTAGLGTTATRVLDVAGARRVPAADVGRRAGGVGATTCASASPPAHVGGALGPRGRPAAAATCCSSSLEHEYHQGGVRCVREQQTLVYRDPPAEPVPLPVDGPPVDLPAGQLGRERRPEPPLLFRFSAITFNSHRIHYDRPVRP